MYPSSPSNRVEFCRHLSKEAEASGASGVCPLINRFSSQNNPSTNGGIRTYETTAESRGKGPRSDNLDGFARFTPGDILDCSRILNLLLEKSTAGRTRRQTLAVSGESQVALRQLWNEGDDHRTRRALADLFAESIRTGRVSGSNLAEKRQQLRDLFNCPGRNNNQKMGFMPECMLENGEFRKFSIGPSMQVQVIPYEFRVQKEDCRPFIDVRLNDLPAENAFVRLAIARFQPHSLPNYHVSEVTLVDFVQMSPDRTVVLWRDPNDYWSERTIRLRIHGGRTVPVSPDSRLDVLVFKEMKNHGWVQATEVIWSLDGRPEAGAILSGTLKWVKPAGPARLVIKETLRPRHLPNGETVELPARFVEILEL